MESTRALPVFIGAAVCIALTNVLGTLIFNAMAWLALGADGGSGPVNYATMMASASYLMLWAGSGVVASTTGGYIAARLSKFQPYLNALSAATVLIAWYLIMAFSGPGKDYQFDTWAILFWIAIPIPCALVGARWCLKMKR